MTSLTLLLWIVLGIALQLAIYLGISFWRHWLGYQTLQARVADSNLSMDQSAPSEAEDTTAAPRQDFRTFKVERKVVEDDAQTICSFYLVPEDGQPLPAFLPGQFLTFRLAVPVATGGHEQVIRCYSLSDAPNPNRYRISIKRVPSPAASGVPPGRASNYFHDQVKVGSQLQVRAASGHFYLDRNDTPVVLIAGGIGITPILSMLNWSLSEQPGREIWLFYGVRNGREHVMKDHLESLAANHPNFHLQRCFSNPLPDEVTGRDYQHRGRVDVDLLRMRLPLKNFHFYICGPTSMLESLVQALEDWGVPDAHVHFEAFGPASIKRKHAITSPVAGGSSMGIDQGISVTFAKSGVQLAWQAGAGNLLDFAEANGITVNSGCRAGGCGSCQTTILNGEVTYRQPPDYDPEPGSCLLCVCEPKTSITLEV
jgi:ferredoxin-NADP reductase